VDGDALGVWIKGHFCGCCCCSLSSLGCVCDAENLMMMPDIWW
jgi:hypothetical protein